MKYLKLISVICAVVIASCTTQMQPESEKISESGSESQVLTITDMQFESSDMAIGKLEMHEFHKVLNTNGILDVPPQNRVSVSAYFGGYIKQMKLLTGEQVKKGQTLFVLENPEFVQFQQDFLEAKAQLAYLKSDYERQKNLIQDNVTSQKNYLKAESEYMVTKVREQSLRKKLILMNIDPNTLDMSNMRTSINVNSPIDGFITSVNFSGGAFINPEEVALTIINTNALLVSLNVFEKDLRHVQIGQSIRFRFQDDNSTEYQAVVHLVNKTVDPEKRTVGVYGKLTDKLIANKLNAGMYVEAEIYTSSESGESLPLDAVVEANGKYYVLAVINKTNTEYSFEQKEVKVGASNDGYIEILNAAEFIGNSEFLVKGAFNLITE